MIDIAGQKRASGKTARSGTDKSRGDPLIESLRGNL